MEKLYEAIKQHSELEDESIIDAGNHGADAGWSGFTYNSDCIEFYDKNEDLIHDFIVDQAEGLGYKNWMEMFSNFVRADMLDMKEGWKVLAAWFVLEEIGRWLDYEKNYK